MYFVLFLYSIGSGLPFPFRVSLLMGRNYKGEQQDKQAEEIYPYDKFEINVSLKR